MPLRFLLAALLVLAAGCRSEQPGEAAEAAPADLVRVDAEGLVDDVNALDAAATVVNVWATWCTPCVAEFPEIMRYGREMAERDIAVRFVSVDEEGALPQVRAFLTRQGVTGRTYVAATGTDLVQSLHPLWTGGIPVTLIFDRDGYVRDVIEGLVNYDYLAARVDQVLAAPPLNQAASRR